MKNIVVLALCCALLLSFIQCKKYLKRNDNKIEPTELNLSDNGPAGPTENPDDAIQRDILEQVQLQAQYGTDWSAVSFWQQGNQGCENTCNYWNGQVVPYRPTMKRLCCYMYLMAYNSDYTYWTPTCYPLDLRNYGCTPN